MEAVPDDWEELLEHAEEASQACGSTDEPQRAQRTTCAAQGATYPASAPVKRLEWFSGAVTRPKIKKALEEFKESDGKSYELPAEINSYERSLVHEEVGKLGLFVAKRHAKRLKVVRAYAGHAHRADHDLLNQWLDAGPRLGPKDKNVKRQEKTIKHELDVLPEDSCSNIGGGMANGVADLADVGQGCGSTATQQSTASSAATQVSIATAPAVFVSPHCFLPKTPFLRFDTRERINASQLRRAGGDTLVGPGFLEVEVQCAVRHEAADRDLVSLYMEGVSSAFTITAEHRLITCGPDGCSTTCLALDFVSKKFDKLFDGNRYLNVTEARIRTKSVPVIEVRFEKDASVLVWLQKSQRSRSCESGTGVAVHGNRIAAAEKLAAIEALKCSDEAPDFRLRRSRSSGAAGDPHSEWSVGTIGHPSNCRMVCRAHHSFLRNQGLPGQHLAKPCANGSACRRCHARHPTPPKSE